MRRLFRKIFPNKELREFRKMHRRHRKELIKLAKETGEWDWSWLHEMVIMQIRHMHEYYDAGNNVWQIDESRLQIVEELKHILDLEDELKRLEDDDCGLKLIYEGDKLVDCIRPDDYLERILKNYERIDELYEEIYNSIGKNLRNWWD